MYPLLASPVALLISLSTATGVFLHDMQIDKAAAAALSLPPAVATYEPTSKLTTFTPDFHIHIERSSLGQTVTDLTSHTPCIQTRLAEDKKHFHKRLVRGHHPFDNYSLPLLS